MTQFGLLVLQITSISGSQEPCISDGVKSYYTGVKKEITSISHVVEELRCMKNASIGPEKP